MKLTKSTYLVLFILILAASLYRVWDGRPMGFAPQIAMALFAGSVLKNKKIAFLFPLLSMLLSDALYQVLYLNGLSTIKGFYGGQWQNYLLIGSITIIGFFIHKSKVLHILAGSLAGAMFYFIISNFLTWIGGGLDLSGQPYPRTMDGLILCFTAAIPFLKWSLLSTFLFSGIFFYGYHLMGKTILKTELQSA